MRLAHDEEIQIVGRDAELGRATDLLERRAPALLLVAGDTGRGKTTFIRAVTRHARSEGWAVAQETLSGAHSVTPTMTPGDFETVVRASLGLSSSPAGTTLIEDLGRRAPVMIPIDGYRPNEAFAGWFLRSFLEPVRDSSKSIVTLIAERREELDDLVPVADETLTFGPLAQAPIRAHFARVGSSLAPPLGDTELEAYVTAGQKDVEALGALTRLLALTSASPARARESG
jgi:hypothetical protein